MVMAIEAQPDMQMLYSDEDKIDENGKRSDPYFKTDWNIDLFYSTTSSPTWHCTGAS
ncbi:MAG: hypothetical protein R3E42_05490 [Burkholderiaceae bacterium]